MTEEELFKEFMKSNHPLADMSMTDGIYHSMEVGWLWIAWQTSSRQKRSYGFTRERAERISLRTMRSYLTSYPNIGDVYV